MEVFADIKAITDLEEGIRTFGHQMAEANNEIEHTVDLYFRNFECGLQILEERLRRAEEELERALRELEHQRSKRVWVEDRDGNGHWEQADCSAEEAAVARCQAVRNRCKQQVDLCRRMIEDARTKRYIHKEQFSQFESKTAEAIDKIGPIKDTVERHLAISVSPSFITPDYSNTSPSFASASSNSRGTYLQRPRPPQNEHINPMQPRQVTEADRPKSPYGFRGDNTQNNASSFWQNLQKNHENTKMTLQMSSISNITTACRGFVDQMNRSAQGWYDDIQKTYYDRRLNPLIGTATVYQTKVYDYMRLLDEYDRQIASMADISPTGFGIGEHELFRTQIDPDILAQMIYRQR